MGGESRIQKDQIIPPLTETQRNLSSEANLEDDGVSFYDGENGCVFSPPPSLCAGVHLTYKVESHNQFVSISELIHEHRGSDL